MHEAVESSRRGPAKPVHLGRACFGAHPIEREVDGLELSRHFVARNEVGEDEVVGVGEPAQPEAQAPRVIERARAREELLV